MTKTYFIVALISYLLGSIPFGYILVKLFHKKDIRETGSGNIGATNVIRSGAKILGIITLALDGGKGALAVWGTLYWFTWALVHDRPWTLALATFAGLCAFLGHLFPFWLKFKGGKGVATGLGVFAILAPKAVLVCLLVFLLTLAAFRYVSLGSILSAAIFPAAANYLYPEYRNLPMMLMVVTIPCFIISKHHENIRRLIAGTEHRIGGKKPGGDAQ